MRGRYRGAAGKKTRAVEAVSPSGTLAVRWGEEADHD